MAISVNGMEIDDQRIEQELAHHRHAANPLKQSVHEVVLRTLLLQEAERLSIAGEDDDARIEALFNREIRVPVADDASCAHFYRNQPDLFSNGELFEVRHILFQVTPDAPLELLHETGAAVLAALHAEPERFDELARAYSNCPSGAVGGSLGQLSRGQTVPEFERALLRMTPGELPTRLLETRFGLHIVQVVRRIEGRVLPFDAALKRRVADYLTECAWQRGIHQYLQLLVGKAEIEGITLEGAGSPLVQ